MVDFNCNYDTVYSGITHWHNITISGNNIDVDAVGGQGQFDFTLTQYTDSNLTDIADENDQTALGSDLYFKLSMANPIPELVYSVQGSLYKFLYCNLLFCYRMQSE